MRYAIGRLLWIVPMVVVVSLVVFWALASTGPVHATDPSGLDGPDLPLFFNPEPRNVRQLSERALRSIAAADEHAEQSGALLVRLGGAALPHVIPRLDALAPDEQARVALALAPIAHRMRVGSEPELTDPESALLFWRRFWEDRAIDFRPTVARRAVERIVRRGSVARHEDLVELDTFALGELIDALGTVHDEADVARVARLSHLASHATNLDWHLPENATPEDATRLVARWQAWWSLRGADYTTYDGPQRVYAMVTETHYGKWATEAATHELGITASGRTVVEVASVHAPWTLWLLVWGLLGGYLAGMLAGIFAAACGSGKVDFGIAATATIVAALPVGVIAAWTSGELVSAVGPAVMALAVAVLVTRYQRAATRAQLDAPPMTTLAAFGASRWGIAWTTWRGSGSVLASLIGVDLPLVITTAFVVEQVLGLPGLSAPTITAVAEHDVTWLMALALTCTVIMGVTQTVGDSLLAIADPRVRAVLSPRREAWE